MRLATPGVPGGEQVRRPVRAELHHQFDPASAGWPGPGARGDAFDDGPDRACQRLADVGRDQSGPDQVARVHRAGQLGRHVTHAGLGQSHGDGCAEPARSGHHHPGDASAAQHLGRGAGQGGRGQGERPGLRGEPGPVRAGEVAGKQGVRRYDEPGGVQRVDQSAYLTGVDLEVRRVHQDAALAAGAVEQVE